MYIFFYIFEWLANHVLWTMLSLFVVGTTLAIMWKFDR
jgi:hypothetical protein